MNRDAQIKVLSIHWGFSIGGVGKYAVLIDGVSKYKDIYINSVVILNKQRQIDRETLDKLESKTVLLRRGWYDLSWFWRLRRELNQFRPHLVLTHGFNGHFVAFLQLLLAKFPFRLICSYHGEYHATTPFRQLLGFAYNRFTEYYIRRKAAATVAVAEYCKKYLVGKGVDPARVEVIHNGIEDIPGDGQARWRLRKKWGIRDNEILLGAISRIDPVKGVAYLVEAFNMLSTSLPHVRLVIVGIGTLERELQTRVSALGLEGRAIFTGFRSDIPDCLEAMDIFVLPSLAEYHSIALLEAMRAGKAIVATDVGGNTESVRHEQEGLIVKPANREELASALERMIMDLALRDRLGTAARKRFLEEFTTKKMLSKTTDWLARSCRC